MTEVETPLWVTYGADIFFLVLFLVVFFFMKPAPDSETEASSDGSEEPNPLEKILVTENSSDTIAEEEISNQEVGENSIENKK